MNRPKNARTAIVITYIVAWLSGHFMFRPWYWALIGAAIWLGVDVFLSWAARQITKMKIEATAYKLRKNK